ncbi:GFA family protein [Halomonas elongata]|uniref:GFA family protein n=1 Tax=Halomonas elongata TaxID=2746 RepID=UPI000DCD3FF0|nr:GFA family protein [Halomonas elongata]RAW06488.1 aldehyde-activating protein [Halomonas elongata]WVI70084.1 GFA family protein [Halomonas elongata]
MGLKGSCLCGGIQYEVMGPLGQAMYCHCQKCRKSNGTAFALNAAIQASDFTLKAGSELLKSHASSEDARRHFCSNCGSPIYSQRSSMPDVLRLRVGTLDDDADLEKVAHIFVGSRASWDEIHDDLPQFAERPV